MGFYLAAGVHDLAAFPSDWSASKASATVPQPLAITWQALLRFASLAARRGRRAPPL
jgi:hypothetical protein